MPNLSDWKPGELYQVLIYGRSGTGKTAGAGTFPRPVIMDFDHGIATLRNPEVIKALGYHDVVYEQFSEKRMTKGGVVTAHNAFDDAFYFFEKMMKPDMRDTFDTWVVDSGTTMAEFAANKAIILLGQQKLSQTHANALTSGLVTPKKQDFGAERSLVEQFVRMVKDAGKHFVFICHEKEIYDKEGNLKDVVPLLTGKSVEEVPLMFDEVYNLQVRRKGIDWVRQLLTHSDGTRMAKTRYGISDFTSWSWDALQAALKTAQASVATPATASPATR